MIIDTFVQQLPSKTAIFKPPSTNKQAHFNDQSNIMFVSTNAHILNETLVKFQAIGTA